ncbi:MAG: exo-alpha-sialidase [Candidatus Omnitrophica bacterium]|nr:exo-alpha-sialidase [Candidatus Omnitrophota bacterium]MCA9446073.1 exo-alpha-sialidase [Candidatus Omnitrophota bacterium]
MKCVRSGLIVGILTVAMVGWNAPGFAQEAVVAKEFIYETAPFPSCHASTLVEVEPGHILAAWFGGTHEKHPDVGIWISHRENGKWSTPVEVAQHEDVPTWNPVLWKDNQTGEIQLYYKAGPDPRTWSGLLIRSQDGGKTWSDYEFLPAGVLGPIKNKPYQLEDGTLICGSSVEAWQVWGCHCEITEDGGRSWRFSPPINLPDNLNGLIQPTIFRTSPRELRMLMRSRGIGRIATAVSYDGGENWSDAELTDLPHPGSGIDAVDLTDGQIALVYNHTERGRSPLNLGISKDGGVNWDNALELENEPGSEFSYPAVIQLSDGNIATTYTWKREKVRFVIIDPDKL